MQPFGLAALAARFQVRGHMLVRRLGIALAVYVSVLACAQAATCPTANEVRSETKRVGPKATLDAAYADTKRWNCVLAGIESTSPSWLSIASSLRSASDAGASSELGVALVNAFEKNPLLLPEIMEEVQKFNFVLSLES